MADTILVSRVRELLDYDPITGVFTRKVRLAQRHKAGDRADFPINSGPMKGYRRVSLRSKRYLAHRLAWLHVHGDWPSNDIDHINGDRGDNRIANLRDVPNRTNRENIRRPRADNSIGFLGVTLHQGKWRARVMVNKRNVELGLFDTPEAAHAAYLEGKRRLHPGCTI